MKVYKNTNTKETYVEGSILTWQVDEYTVWSGVPTKEQLVEWGFEEMTIPQPTEREVRMQEILQELSNMDYLTSKYIDGEDMTEYGDWLSKRKALREEYRELEAQA